MGRFKPHLRELAIVAAAVALALIAADRIDPPDMTRYQTLSPEVAARDGTLLRPFLSKDGYWRLKTTPAEVDPRYLTLLKAYEDKRFDSHFGVDPLALARAAFQFVTTGHVVSGASTLTMQAARLLEPGRPRTVLTKLVQMARAVQLEERYSKNEILSIYLTLAPFGGNLEGVRAASLAYFGKEPGGLDLSQAATLVALPQSPERQRPDRHALAAKRARDKVLARMVSDGVIAGSDAAVAMAEGVAWQRLAMPMTAPRLAGRLARSIKGPRIVTTLDAPLQRALERMAANERAYLSDGGSLAIVVADNRTHGVLAYVGGTDYWGASGQIDLARRPRSPGSALKPFIYGLAFDDLILHPQTMMEDEPTQFGDYAPRDFSGGFQGAVTASEALREVPERAGGDGARPRRSLAFHAGARECRRASGFPDARGGADASGGAGRARHHPGRHHHALYRHRRWRRGAAAALSEGRPAWAAASAVRQSGGVLSAPDPRRRGAAGRLGDGTGARPPAHHRLQDRHILRLPRCVVGRLLQRLHRGRVGRPRRRCPTHRQCRARNGGTHSARKPSSSCRRTGSAPLRAPAGAIEARASADLPAGLRVFRLSDEAPRPRRQAQIPPPSIAFPPNGATVPLPQAGAGDKTIELKASGGREPLTWLVDGRLLGSFTRFQPVLIAPPGAGFARITVVDAEGRSDSSQVRFKRLP